MNLSLKFLSVEIIIFRSSTVIEFTFLEIVENVYNQAFINNYKRNILEYVSRYDKIPTLKGILMEVRDNKLNLTASDMDINIETFIEVSDCENGSIVVPAKLFNEVIKIIIICFLSIFIFYYNIFFYIFYKIFFI